MENKKIINSVIELDGETVFVSSEAEEEIVREILERRPAHGRVRWYDRSLGYGFVREDGDSKELFVHQSSIQVPGVKKLRAGQRIVFERCLTERGEIALNVVPVMERPAQLERYHAKQAKQSESSAEKA